MKRVASIRRTVQRSHPLAFAIATLGVAITTMGGGQARADFQIPVPNGDFSVASNDGHVGGALVGGSGTAMIGTGPWSGTYNSAVGLLLQPRLDIAPGVATISGVSNVGVGSIVDTSAYFSQSLGLAYNKSDTYMLTADVDAGSLLGLSLLTKGVGIALLNGGSVLASTSGTGSPMISLNFLSGTEYQLQLTYNDLELRPDRQHRDRIVRQSFGPSHRGPDPGRVLLECHPDPVGARAGLGRFDGPGPGHRPGRSGPSEEMTTAPSRDEPPRRWRE